MDALWPAPSHGTTMLAVDRRQASDLDPLGDSVMVPVIVAPSSAVERTTTRAMVEPPIVPSARTVSKFHVPEIVFGPGSLSEAGNAARRLGARRVFVVTDPGIIEAGWVRELHRKLRDAGLPQVTWHGITPNPKDHEVTSGYEQYRMLDCDVIIGVGGAR